MPLVSVNDTSTLSATRSYFGGRRQEDSVYMTAHLTTFAREDERNNEYGNEASQEELYSTAENPQNEIGRTGD